MTEQSEEKSSAEIKQTKYSIFASRSDIFNISFCIQILIILYGIVSIIDFAVDVLTIYTRVIGLSVFAFQLVVNYNIHYWCIPHLEHELCIPHKTNCNAWIMLHFLMPIAIGRWPQLLWHKCTASWRNTYPSLIFWGSSRSGTTTFAHHLRMLQHPSFVGPLSSITAPLAYNKEGVFFIATYGCNQNHNNYSLLYPMREQPDTIYFDGYPEYHCFPFVRDRMYDINPDMKFIFFVREPCSKVVSQWIQLQDTYLQVTGSRAFGDDKLNALFRASLDVIQSDKYEKLYQFFVSMKMDEFPNELKQNIADWCCECVLGRAMLGRDLRFWFDKFNNPQNWLILDMQSILKDTESVKSTVQKICEFVGAALDDEFMQNWIPTTLKLNQNNIKYTPPDEYMVELKRFYQEDQRILYDFIKEKEIQFVCDTSYYPLSG